MNGLPDQTGGADPDTAAGMPGAEGATAQAQIRGDAMSDQLTPEQTCRKALAVLDEVEKAVVGKRAALELVLLGVLAGGHVLIEDLPGLGKTLMARSFATALGLDFTRIQFTPDLLPSDVTGAPFYDQRGGDMVFRPGPVFTQLLLADEINRTPPKTQAALLEAMGEGQVSVDGKSHQLDPAFVVLATDNPIEYEGTYALPEAQLDRFLLRVRMGYLPPSDEAAMLLRRLDRKAERVELAQIVDAEQLLAMRTSLESVEVSADVVDYVVALVNATRAATQVQVGASPRGGLALVQLARARAALSGRDYVIPEDVKAIAVPALAHRITLRPELWVRRVSADEVVASLLTATATPRTLPRQQDAAGAAAAGTGAGGSAGGASDTPSPARSNPGPAQKPAGAHR
nr:MoxR family ATPase [Catenulispora pinistramenti]